MNYASNTINNDKLVRVCHMTSAHERYDQRIFYGECVSLHAAGYDVSLLVNDEYPNEEIKGIKIKSTKRSYRGKRFKRMIFGVNDIYRLAKEEDAEVYHFHDPELMRIALKLKKRGKKVIYDSHEIYSIQIKEKNYLPKIVRNFIANIYSWYESYILKRIDGVVFPIKMDRIDFESRAKNVVYVNNVPRMDDVIVAGDTHLKRKGVCYTGGLTYARGISYLVEAAHIAQIPVYLAGPFESDEFKEHILSNNEDGMVHYLGVLSREEVYRLYSECCMGASTLLPIGQYAFVENLATKVYEYMSMELPVILSDTPYNRKMIEKYNFGVIVNPENSVEIAEKMKYLLANLDMMKKMGENGKKIVFEEWNWCKEEEKLLQFYEKIVK